MIRFEFYNDDTAVIIKYIGKISKEEIISFTRHHYKPTLETVLSDYTEAELDFNVDDTKEIGENWSTQIQKPLRSALLIKESKSTAIALWFTQFMQPGLLNTGVFSTLEACIYFLSWKMSKELLAGRISNLKFQFRYDISDKAEDLPGL